MLQLLSAVEHMHAHGVYHRDIKPENIFLTQDGSMKLGDFGLATTEKWSEESSVGSDRYMAPEQYDTPAGGYSAEKADIWAIGICLLNILFARNPFVSPTLDDPLFADYVRDRESLFDVFPTLSYDTFRVISHCLAIDPSKRDLKNVREAIEQVENWTIDDEAYDDFLIEDEVVSSPVSREPLRTPSIQSPAIAQGTCFPWAQALQMTQLQQVSIMESDDGVPEFTDERCPSAGEYAKQMGFYVPPPSSYESGFGESFSSVSISVPVSKSSIYGDAMPENIAINSTKKASKFSSGNGETFVSKSWSYDSVGVAEDFGDDDVEWIVGWEDDLNL
jgi:serine/threonine protein kinase